MKTLDFILPAKNPASASDLHAPSLPKRTTKPPEPFDKMMNRALGKSTHEVEKPEPPRKPSPTPPVAHKSKLPAREPSTNAGTSPLAEPAKVSAPENPATTQPDDSAHADSASADDSAKNKTATHAAPANSAGTDNAVAAQPVAANVMANQPPPVAPDISKPTQGPAEIISAGTATESRVETSSSAELNAPPENALAPKTDVKPESKESGAGKKVSGTQTDPAKKSGSADGAVSIEALFGKGQPVNETPVNTADSTPPKPHILVPDATGTSAAEHQPTMKNADQAAKVAEAPEQSLPGVSLIASAVQAAVRSKPPTKGARVESADASAPASSAALDRAPSAAQTSESSLISASSQTELRTRALDRTHDIVALHGLQLRQSNTDSLHVVIKPGAGLQLSLQMKQTRDGIEAQAILQQGNFEDLNKHWAELQQRLEERGIRLAPLGNDSATANGGDEHFQRQSRQPGQSDSLSAGAFAEFASASAPTPRTPPAPSLASRGWESWA